MQPDRLAEALVESQAHVHRSRLEPGCVSHAVYQDPEDPNKLFFFERWADEAAMRTHFAVPESRAFARALNDMCSQPAEMVIYEAAPTS